MSSRLPAAVAVTYTATKSALVARINASTSISSTASSSNSVPEIAAIAARACFGTVRGFGALPSCASAPASRVAAAT